VTARGLVAPVLTDVSLDKFFSDLPESQKDEELELRQELKRGRASIVQTTEALGRVLVGYKAILAHGKWLPFLGLLGLHEQTAQRYMRAIHNREELGVAGVTALEDQGYKAPAINRIAERVIAKRNACLERMPVDQEAYGDPITTEEQERQFLLEARNEESNTSHLKYLKPEVDTPTVETQEDRERRQRVFSTQPLETYRALRSAYRNDQEFKPECGRRFKEAMATSMPWLEVVNA
jgi:hypothetical protein